MQTVLFTLGLVLFLIGLLTGFAVAALKNPRMALSSHLEAVLNGMFLVLIGQQADQEQDQPEREQHRLHVSTLGARALRVCRYRDLLASRDINGCGRSRRVVAEIYVSWRLVAAPVPGQRVPGGRLGGVVTVVVGSVDV
ncbi:hypothetical protein A9X05_10165 [Mycobacterium sp. E3298]|nr:hypothetical protein A5704_12585 [Mycobacterium sp. E735]OBG92824.1 hypothetical protein A9X05_10165 [Mycobacterium sp. E3298]